MNQIKGKVWILGDDIDTDAIIPARYLTTWDPVELADHCLEDVDPGFATRVAKGDIIVAGKNFGCGSSREHAPLAIKAAGISCVVAESFARIFYRNSINIGLPILECPSAVKDIRPGDILAVDLAKGVVSNITQDQRYEAVSCPPFMQGIIEAGGLIDFVGRTLRKDG